MGKHTKKIVCGTWTPDNKLLLGAEDKNVSVSRPDGENLCSVVVSAPCPAPAENRGRLAGDDQLQPLPPRTGAEAGITKLGLPHS